MQARRFFSAAMAAVMAAGLLTFGTAAPAAAKESSKEKLWKYGTYAGAAATAAALLKNKDTWAAIGAGATGLSYLQWKKETSARNKRQRRARALAAQRRYQTSRYNGSSAYRSRTAGRRYTYRNGRRYAR